MYFLLDNIIVAHLKNAAGGSIDAFATKIEENKVTGMTGKGYSIISKGLMPSCTKEAGCGIPIAGAVELAGIDTKWDFEKADYTLDQLEVACAWKNTAKAKEDRTKEDYKLAYKLPNGKIVWHGVHAAMAALNGARQDVNIPTKDRKTVYNVLKAAYKLFEKEPPELKATLEVEIKEKGGLEKDMADKIEEKAEVSFSAEQVAEIKAAAIAEVTETLGNAHKVEMTTAETAKADELKTLTDAHVIELEKQRTETFERAAMIESLSTQYSLTEEAKKALIDAKTLEEALTLFSTLKITKPIAGGGAAEEKKDKKDGKDEKGGGVIMGGGAAEEKAPETIKVPEVGSYDPIKGEYIEAFREEPI